MHSKLSSFLHHIHTTTLGWLKGDQLVIGNSAGSVLCYRDNRRSARFHRDDAKYACRELQPSLDGNTNIFSRSLSSREESSSAFKCPTPPTLARKFVTSQSMDE
jgi:hypothetical protein